MKNFPGQQGRFSKIFSESDCLLPAYDRPLQKVDGCAVVPTLGSILPNWLLIIPEEPVLNFREWEARRARPAMSLVQDFLHSRNIEAKRAIWFEHGPSRPGTSVGCGIDHAHLHVLIDAPFKFGEFLATAEQMSERPFVLVSSDTAIEVVPDGVPYLLLASGDSAAVATGVEDIGSQFLRRVVAKLAGEPDSWNYRTHPWIGNVEKTLQTFAPV